MLTSFQTASLIPGTGNYNFVSLRKISRFFYRVDQRGWEPNDFILRRMGERIPQIISL